MHGALTPPEGPGEDLRERRVGRWVAGALLWMMIIAATPYRARAEEASAPAPAVERLVRRAFVRAGLDGASDLPERVRRSALWPWLQLGASVRRPIAPSGIGGFEVSALLGWPLERRIGGDGGVAALRSSRRSALSERVAALWRIRARLAAARSTDDEISSLKAAEVDAELEALTGEPDDLLGDER